MSVDLHPDIVRAIRALSDTRTGRRYDRFARRKYGISGARLAAKQAAGEGGGRPVGQAGVSSAGARGPTQFMPATRQEMIDKYGIDPWRSNREAIKAMELYDMQRGSVAGYNPGMPSYTSYILGQRLNKADRRALRGGGRSAGSGMPSLSGTRTSVSLSRSTVPGISFAAERSAAKADLLLGGPLTLNRLLDYKRTTSSLRDVPARTQLGDLSVKHHKFKVPVGSPTNDPARGTKGGIYEVFYDPLGKYWDSGGVRQGSIGGHGDHVHVSADKALVIRLGKYAQRLGLHVGENPHFGGVCDRCHVEGSFHYKDEAIDVSGNPAAMRKFARVVMREARNGRGR